MKLLSKLILLSALTTALPLQAADTYTFDPDHTYALWSVSHFDYSTITGKFMAKGTLELDEANPAKSKVNVSIQVKDIMTGIPKFNEHLLSKDFFNAGEYPVATFTSDKIDMTGEKSADVHGTLTIHGVSKPVTFKVLLNNKGMHSYLKKMAVGFSGETTIKRSDFGMGQYVPSVGDFVQIHIEAEAGKTS